MPSQCIRRVLRRPRLCRSGVTVKGGDMQRRRSAFRKGRGRNSVRTHFERNAGDPVCFINTRYFFVTRIFDRKGGTAFKKLGYQAVKVFRTGTYDNALRCSGNAAAPQKIVRNCTAKLVRAPVRGFYKNAPGRSAEERGAWVFASTEKGKSSSAPILCALICACVARAHRGESFRSVCNIVAAAGARNGITLIAEQFIGMFNGDNRNFKLRRQKTFGRRLYRGGSTPSAISARSKR